MGLALYRSSFEFKLATTPLEASKKGRNVVIFFLAAIHLGSVVHSFPNNYKPFQYTYEKVHLSVQRSARSFVTHKQTDTQTKRQPVTFIFKDNHLTSRDLKG